MDFVEEITDGEFGGDLGDGKSGRFGRERRAAATRGFISMIDHATVVGIDAKLDVRAAGFDADGADHGEARVAHDLKFLVRQGLDRRDRDAVAGMHAHGVEVFDGADDDAVGLVPHYLHFIFLPAQQRFFDEISRRARGSDAALGDLVEFVAVVGDAAARAARA